MSRERQLLLGTSIFVQLPTSPQVTSPLTTIISPAPARLIDGRTRLRFP
ncbi:MAG: hypothetical protein IRZ16_15980 [Myxococcaceae bacterium]|nr:hypothetical protein [Myxococcaceae bacterium]